MGNELLESISLDTMPFTSNDTVINVVDKDDKVGRLAVRDKIENYQKVLQDMCGSEHGDRDKLNEGLDEYIIDGAYVRGLFIPKDTTIVSKIWNRDRLWIIVTGDVTITTELGTQRVKAPYTVLAPYGTKVALYTHEDTMWYAISGVKSTTLEDVNNEVFTDDYTGCAYSWDLLEGKED